MIVARLLIAAAVLVAAAATRAPALDAPRLPAGTVEVHGTFAGEPFWARVLPPDRQYGGNRVLQLVYQPPPPERLGGARLPDCPFVLLDEQGRVVAWNGRDTLSHALPAAPTGYSVTRELAAEGAGSDERVIAGERGWDLHLAPLMLALTWRPGAASVRVVDLFGARADEHLVASWDGAKAELAGAACTIDAGPDGQVRAILDAAGKPLLQIVIPVPGASP